MATKLRVLRAEIESGQDTHLRVLRAEIESVVAPKATLRVLRAEIESVAAPRLRVIRAEIVSVVALAANAGAAQSVQSLDRVTLSGAASSGEPYPNSFSWAQTSGPPVVLDDPATVSPSFTAPATDDGAVLAFVLTVGNGVDVSASSSPVQVTVAPHLHWVNIGGVARPVVLEVAGRALLLGNSTLLGEHTLLGP